MNRLLDPTSGKNLDIYIGKMAWIICISLIFFFFHCYFLWLMQNQPCLLCQTGDSEAVFFCLPSVILLFSFLCMKAKKENQYLQRPPLITSGVWHLRTQQSTNSTLYRKGILCAPNSSPVAMAPYPLLYATVGLCPDTVTLVSWAIVSRLHPWMFHFICQTHFL